MNKRARKSGSKVWVPPEKAIPLPVRPRLQTLPLNELPWDIFQRLCARLAQRSGDVEFSQGYGLPGQDQEGIDIYIRPGSTGRYSVWQCKRYQEITKAVIKSTVDEFEEGDWLSKSDEFVICVSSPTEERSLADEIEAQNRRLRVHGVRLIALGETQLSERLKEHPDLVDDFLGREWVKEFCGPEAAGRLSRRILNPEQISRLRGLLHRCYAQYFETVDPGLPSLTSPISRGPEPFPLPERFILPDVLERREVSQAQAPSPETTPQPADAVISSASPAPAYPRAAREPSHMITFITEFRRPALEWLIEGGLSVVIGDPGIGKSSLLRYVLLDLLSSDPRHEALAIKWGDRLPVWVPFAMWTRMVAESESGCSLSDVLKTWLRRVCAPVELVELVQQALEDSRLLLFVDGLDEWSNETAARSTVALLEQFVGERQVPALASSRPLGFERLGGLSGRWRRAKLAGLTADQQREFAFRWFLHQSRAILVSGGQADGFEAEHFAAGNAAELTEDIQREERLTRLAQVPLLLSGLIALSVQRVRLPRSRFKAYEELTRLLLQEQPQRRDKAAHARSSSNRLSQETRDRALARLAYEVHQAPGSDAIEKAAARDVLHDFFIDYLQKPSGEALELAEQILAIGSETVGILVEKSPQEVGFLHRAFQEFLAALHLSNLPFDEQKEAFKTWFVNPQWYDVLLCLCHLNTRTGEVDALMDIVGKAALPPEFLPAREVFLAEVAFSDLHCSAQLASTQASHVYIEIETGTERVLRERLLEHALDGLFSDVLRAETEACIKRWYPARHRFRQSVYTAMAKWPREPETIEAFWRGLFDEEEWNQRAAAEALARGYGGDSDIGDRLLRLLLAPAESTVTAYTLHALCLGWPKEPRLPQVLQEAGEAADWTLRLVAISHRVKRQEQDFQDRNALMQFATDGAGGSWRWREDAVEALVTGWPNDTDIKNLAIKSLSAYGMSGTLMSRDFAGPILMRGFPQDDEVAKAIAGLFKQERYPGHLLGLNVDWTPLVQSFEGHPLLRDAVDDWLEKVGARFWECQCCLISKSPRAKKHLLKPSEKTGVIDEYQARWLLEGWGMNDPEASQALSKLVESEVASRAAPFLPQIIKDRGVCRGRLLNWLRNEPEDLAQLALIGLIKLGCDERDTEVADTAAERFAGKVPCGATWWGVSDVIARFPNHPRVRELALHQCRSRGGEIGSVADAYKDDLEMHREVLKRINFLPAYLRLRVVDRLAGSAREDGFAHQSLSEYDEDTGGQVKTAAAIGYARSVKKRGEDQTLFIEKLSQGICAVGLDLSERRQAAFAALVELDRIDVVASANTRKPGSFDIEVSSLGETNLRLAAHLADNWNRVQTAFDGTFWERVGYMPDEFLEEMATHTNDTSLVEAIASRMGGKGGDPNASVALLQMRSLQWRRTDQLRRICLDLVSKFYPTDWIHAAPCILAAEILSEQFADDMATKQELESFAEQVPNPTPLIIALCAAWPESPALKQLSEEKKSKRLLLPAKLHLLCRFTPPDEFVVRLGQTLPDLTGNIWEFLPSCGRAIRSRFERDDQVRELSFLRLEAGASPAEKTNLPLFLRRTDTQLDRLRAWCRGEFGRQISGEHLPDFALDIFSARVRPVAHLMLEVLAS